MTTGSADLPVGTHCEWCGAEFEPGSTLPAAHTPPAKPAPVPDTEPVTHCEWCGAEYPVPADDR